MSPTRKFIRPLVAVLVSLVLLSCSSTDDQKAGAVSEEALQSVLGDVSRAARARVMLAVEEMRSNTNDPELQRRAIEWQLGVNSAIRYARTLDDARAGIIELWTRSHQMKDTIDSDLGKKYYGEEQPIAAKAADELIQLTNQAGRELVGAAKYDEVLAQIKDYANKHAFATQFKREAAGPSGILEAGGSAVGWVLRLPMKPFELGEGVGETAHSIQNVAVVADRAADIVDDLPEQARLQAELLLLDLDRVESLNSVIADLGRVTNSIEAFQKTAATLPEDVRKQVTVVLDQIDTKQVELQKTLDHAKGLLTEANDVVHGAKQTIEEVNTAVVQAKVTAESLQPVLTDLTAAGEAWTVTANAVTKFIEIVDPPEDPNAPPEPAPATPPAGSGSAIVDLGDSSVKLTAAATQLRGLTENLLTIIQSNDLTKRIEDVDGLAATTVDHITWRAMELIVVLFGSFFGLLFAYKFAAMKFLSR